jgi:uncharacterized membrane protein
MIQLALFLHIGGGTIGLLSGAVAVIAKKGGRIHRRAGNIFVASMLIMAIFAIYLGIVIPDQLVNVVIGTFSLYLVTTAWLTVQRTAGDIGLAEKIGLAVILCLLAPFATLSFQLAAGLPPFLKSALPYKGAILIAVYSFTAIFALAALSDLKLIWAGGISGAPRIARHLWRMCLGLTLATGSGFTNGVARLLPGPYHVPTVLFLPQFIPLILLIFWMIRVRFTGWSRQTAQAQDTQNERAPPAP